MIARKAWSVLNLLAFYYWFASCRLTSMQFKGCVVAAR